MYLKDITDVDYIHAQKVSEEFKFKNQGEYHDLYVQSDTLFSEDVFENFINKCIEIYKLDPAHFLSTPGLAWQACLKKAGVKLELLTDNAMLMMIEKEITDGICHAIYRYAKSNNKYMKNYNKNIELSYLMYLDENNLHGWEMSQELPVNGDGKNVSKFDEDFIKNYNQDSNTGYILEVDVEYPKDLHNWHSDLPFISERIKIKNCNKLVCNIYDKENYVVHIRALKEALNHELILTEVHKVIQFNQEAWLKPYIDMNAKLRTKETMILKKIFLN